MSLAILKLLLRVSKKVVVFLEDGKLGHLRKELIFLSLEMSW